MELVLHVARYLGLSWVYVCIYFLHINWTYSCMYKSEKGEIYTTKSEKGEI
jgi:hypothetical protein